MKYKLPQLPYSYSALEPYIDARTMELHHGQHHAAYVNKLNEALDKHPSFTPMAIGVSEGKPELELLEALLKNLGSIPEDIRTAVRNHGGGHYNHSFFWSILAPVGKGGEPIPAILNLKEEFNKAAAGLFGSGWVWIVKDAQNNLKIVTTANQDTVLTSDLRPLIGLDLWEHAYYLKYQNRRLEYIEAWWNVVNWNHVKDQ